MNIDTYEKGYCAGEINYFTLISFTYQIAQKQHNIYTVVT